MDREILFRGKRVDNGEWIEGYYVPIGKQVHYMLTGILNLTKGYPVLEHFSVIPETIGEYTGLTDKNGKKIFEGDICKNSLGIVFTVEWDENNARFLGCTVQHERRIVYVGREPMVEVIGNIHDNPELLEVGK